MTAPIRSMEELVKALRDRRDELQLTHETIDQIAGLQGGYSSKLLAPNPIKNLGWMSLGSVLGALGIALVAIEDPEQVKRIEGRWQRRERPQRKTPLSMPLSIDAEVPAVLQITPALQRQLRDPERMKLLGSLGGKARMTKLTRQQRVKIARKAIVTRWRRQRERERVGA